MTQTTRTDHQRAGEKQPAEADHPDHFILTVKFDSALMYLHVYGKKFNFLS